MYRHNSHYQKNRFTRPQGGRGGRTFRRIKSLPNDPTLFIKHATEEKSEVYAAKNSFSDFNIHAELAKNILSKGYKTPTPIQDMAIPALLEGKDVVGIANTGTGKTAAFLIPLINKMLKSRQEKVLVIAPTRELAVQIEQEFKSLTKGVYIQSVICIGGVSISGQIQRLRNDTQLVVGTPGRLKDLEERRKISFRSFRSIVLDEVDRMLDMGFIKDVTYIVSKLSYPRQSLFFSATLPESVQSVLRNFAHEPVVISVKKEPTSNNVDQDVIRLNGRQKIEVLDGLLQNREFEKVLVFGRTKHGIDKIEKALARNRVSVASIHGNKTQNQRQRALDMFKSNKVQVLLATDIASRGLDISNVTHVINYDLPETYEAYVHRIGRTGRADKKGKALTFIE